MSDPATFKAVWNCCRMPGSRRIPRHGEDGHLTRGPCDRRIVVDERGGDYDTVTKVLKHSFRDQEDEMHTTLDSTDPTAKALPRRHAVVVGGGLAGMLAARVLADHFDGVTLLERDRFTETPAARKGLPQGRHVHVLLERGRGAMERFLPGLTGELVRAGEKPLDATRDVAWMNPYGWYVRFPGDLLLLASTRDLIDWGVRGRVAALPNVRIHQEADVAGLIRGPGDGARVAGVRLRSRTADAEVDRGGAELAADLVVVANGRNSRLPEWLTAWGTSRRRRRWSTPSRATPRGSTARPRSSSPTGRPCTSSRPRRATHAGASSPRSRGALARLAGRRRRPLPAHRRGRLPRGARTLRIPDLYEAIRDAEPLGPIVGYRAPRTACGTTSARDAGRRGWSRSGTRSVPSTRSTAKG